MTEDRLIARVACHSIVQKAVENFRKLYPDYDQWVEPIFELWQEKKSSKKSQKRNGNSKRKTEVKPTSSIESEGTSEKVDKATKNPNGKSTKTKQTPKERLGKANLKGNDKPRSKTVTSNDNLDDFFVNKTTSVKAVREMPPPAPKYGDIRGPSKQSSRKTGKDKKPKEKVGVKDSKGNLYYKHHFLILMIF